MPDRKIYTPPPNKVQLTEDDFISLFSEYDNSIDLCEEGILTKKELEDKMYIFFKKFNSMKDNLDVLDNNKKDAIESKFDILLVRTTKKLNSLEQLAYITAGYRRK